MLHKRKQGLWMLTLLCWTLFAVPAQAETAEPVQIEASEPALIGATGQASDGTTKSAQKLPISPVKVENTPEEDYQTAVKAMETRNSLDAVAYFKRAADAGHRKAQARYGDFLRSGQLIPEALRYLRMSIQSDPAGQYALGAIYEEGDGIKQDFGVSRFLFGLAAEQGHEDAAARLAEVYLKGQKGLDATEQQGPEALAAIRRAAGFNHLRALDALEAAYREGKFGIAADKKQADVILAITNKMRGIVIKVKEKSALYKLLKGDPKEKAKQTKE